MTITDYWAVMPLLIIAAGALVVLSLARLLPDRYGTVVGVVVLLGAAFWCLQALRPLPYRPSACPCPRSGGFHHVSSP